MVLASHLADGLGSIDLSSFRTEQQWDFVTVTVTGVGYLVV
jgi:hypothetical protein